MTFCLTHYTEACRKSPLLRPGFMQVRNGFWMGLQTEGLISGVAYNRNKKKRCKVSYSGVDHNTFFT